MKLAAGVFVVGVAAFVYTVWRDTANNHRNHSPILYPRWMSAPGNGDGRWMIEESHRQ